jgi:hypothetical protein
MQTAQQLLEELQINNLPHTPNGNFIITDKQREAILSLLSQQSEGVSESDEKAAEEASKIESPFVQFACKHYFLLGCKHVRQQLSQQQLSRKGYTNGWEEGFEEGSRSLKQQLSQQQQQRSYSEEDMLSFCEWVANERWREDFLEQRTLTTKDLLDIYNNLPK